MMPFITHVSGGRGPGAQAGTGVRGAPGSGADFEALLAQMLGLGSPAAPANPAAAGAGTTWDRAGGGETAEGDEDMTLLRQGAGALEDPSAGQGAVSGSGLTTGAAASLAMPAVTPGDGIMGLVGPGAASHPGSSGNTEPAPVSTTAFWNSGSMSGSSQADPGGTGGPVTEGKTPSGPAPAAGDKAGAGSNPAPVAGDEAGPWRAPPSASAGRSEAAGLTVPPKDSPPGTAHSGAPAGDAPPLIDGGRVTAGTGKARPIPAESPAPGTAANTDPHAGVSAGGRRAVTVAVDPGSGGTPPARAAGGTEGRNVSTPPAAGAAEGNVTLAAQAPPPAAGNPPPGLSTSQVVQQVMLHLDLMREHPGRPVRVEISVDPPHLGPVTVKVALVRGELTAQFFTPDGAVRDAIQAVLPQLREQLAQHQLQLGQAEVFLGHGSTAADHGRDRWWQAPEMGLPFDSETRAPDPETPAREPASPGRLNYLV